MRTKMKFSSVIATLFAFVFLAGLNTAIAQDSVVDVINASEDHTIFSELLEESELDNVIAQPGPFTVVAPTDEAFEAMGDELNQIRENPDALQNVVIGHLFQGEVTAEEAEPALGITVVTGDIPASNGLVHTTNEVIQN